MPSKQVFKQFKQKHAGPDLRLDTDVLIFDRISYDTIRSLLDYARRSSFGEKSRLGDSHETPSSLDAEGAEDSQIVRQLPDELDDMLRMVNAFHTLFTTAHGPIDALTASTSHLQPAIRILHFRLLLLRLTILFLARKVTCAASPSAEALASLRHANRMRAVSWGARVGAETRVFPKDVLGWYANLQNGDEAMEDAKMQDADDGPEPHESSSQRGSEYSLPLPVSPPLVRLRRPRDGTKQPDGQEEQDQKNEQGAQGEENGADASVASVEQDEDLVTTLLDLLPLFITLTAVRSTEDSAWRTTEQWLRLAAEMMLLAAHEQLLPLVQSDQHGTGRSAEGILVETFAWGIEGAGRVEGPEMGGNAVFALGDEDDGENAKDIGRAWARLREACMLKLLPPIPPPTNRLRTIDLTNDTPQPLARSDRVRLTRLHLKSLSKRNSLAAFDKQMLSFLDGLCESYPRPVLLQLDDLDATDGGILDMGADLQVSLEEQAALRKMVHVKG